MATAGEVPVERRLASALEPVIGQVYFSPEAHAAYEKLGFDPSPGSRGGVAAPDGAAYFTSRGSLMGQVHGTVVAAAFAVFEPEMVESAVARGWQLTDATKICAARDQGALDQLSRILGPAPEGLPGVSELLVRAADAAHTEGRPLAAGVRAIDPPDHPFGPMFRAGDLLRELRGDSHTASWVAAGLDAVEIGLLTELYWGLPLRSYTRTRGWGTDDFDEAEERLRAKGLIDASGAFTDAGRQHRDEIERGTDRQMSAVVGVLGDDIGELISTLASWGAEIRAGRGYLPTGPHDLAAADPILRSPRAT